MSVDLPTGVSLEIDLLQPLGQEDGRRNKLAILLHPWSWLGGRMHDPVLALLVKPLREEGFHTLRFNSRGVGSSTGWASFTGTKEGKDLEALVQWALGHVTDVESVVLIGYSHGGLIASLHPVLPNIKTSHVLLSYPLSPRGWITMFNSSTYQSQLEMLVQDDNSNVLVIYGDEDEFTSISKYRRWSGELESKATDVEKFEIAGGTHFWRGRAGDEMQQSVIGWLTAITYSQFSK